ncbi:MAG: M14 family metallocarboxypeptidase [Myxococcales bacterium]|nr:M14 family metallocarboxypeptidase [Myxococcales bacterium]
MDSIGTPGVPWGASERARWRGRQGKRRSYADEVVAVLERLRRDFDVVSYGALEYPPDGTYPLFALKSRAWDDALPLVMVTGGVHGYETSGVHGALLFTQRDAAAFAGKVNLVIAPCVSPWAYERIHRWNPDAVDPNRSFKADGAAGEARRLMEFIAPLRGRFLMHIDLHETTDSDESEFRPALAARDGKVHQPGEIPDGFYLVDDAENRQPGFQEAIIAAVERVTHIAPPDARGHLIGEKVLSRGVIQYAVRELGLCASLTGARFTTTTEVYPDSPRVTPAQCNEAQATAVRAGLEFALAHR